MLRQTEQGTEPSALRSTPAGFCHFGNLTFTFGPDHGSGRWMRGAVPCPELATLLVMALITGSGHEVFFFYPLFRVHMH